MTDAVIFNSQGNNMLPADILYKKNIFAVRGSFRPVTKVNIDMLQNGLDMFMKDAICTQEETEVLIEITISNLRADGDIDERDFLDRVDVLGKLGIYRNYFKLLRILQTD
jgi:myo-inositol catabolism protein IolC